MKRRTFISALPVLAAVPVLARPKQVMLQATIAPVIQGVPLWFTLGNQAALVSTDQNGVASAVFRCRRGQASVSGTILGESVSDSTTVSC